MDRTSDVTLSQLRTFLLVMQQGGYAAAAKESHLSVPSVWQHIRSLETAYGVQLFERKGRQVQATPAARKLYAEAEEILNRLDSTFDTVQAKEGQAIRLVTGVRMLLEDLAAPLAKFRASHANPLVVLQGNDQRAEQLLLADEADIALTLEPGPKRASPRIHYEPAYTVEFLAIARKSHPIMKSKRTSLRELAKHQLVVTLEGTHGRDALDQALYRENLKAKIAAETDNSAFTIACVAAGMGVGILAGRPEGELCKNLSARSLSKQLGLRQIVLMWQKGRLLSDALIDLIELIKHERS